MYRGKNLRSVRAAIDALTKIRLRRMEKKEPVDAVWECADAILQLPSAEHTKPKEESYEINVCPYCGIDLAED